MDESTQPTLIPGSELPPERNRPPISADTSLQAAIGEFEQFMRQEGFSNHTIKAFTSDLRLLGKYLGIGHAIGIIGTKDLNDFLYWLAYERGVPCSPKSYARRVTSLKVFFGWLETTQTLMINPSNAVIQRSVTSPLPQVPDETDLTRALAVTQAWRAGEDRSKPDARSHLLLTLLLKTGVKKSEVMALVPNHVDRGEDSDDGQPMLFVRYKTPRLRYKERKIPIDHAWLEVLDEYLAQYQPSDTLFTCTARNLEYILGDIAEAAGLERALFSFENLRWASALRDYMAQVDPDTIRQRLGLSKITWRETRHKLDKLIDQGYTRLPT